MECTFVSMDKYGNYVVYTKVPDMINEMKKNGYTLLQPQWIPDGEVFTLFQLGPRKTVKTCDKTVRRSSYNIFTIFPMLKLFKHTHFW